MEWDDFAEYFIALAKFCFPEDKEDGRRVYPKLNMLEWIGYDDVPGIKDQVNNEIIAIRKEAFKAGFVRGAMASAVDAGVKWDADRCDGGQKAWEEWNT